MTQTGLSPSCKDEQGAKATRRHVIASLASYGLFAEAAWPRGAAATPASTIFNVTLPPFDADPAGNADSSAAFQAALDAISKAGRGVLYVPAGFYLLSKPLTCTNAALTMMGDGSSSSVLVIRHAETALAVTCEAMSQCVTIHDIGFTPVPGGSGTAGAAIAIVHPNQPSGWPGCVIEDVDLGVPYPGYTVFDSGLELENLWRGHIRNVNWHSNIGSVSRTRFAVLGGTCIDNIFTGCTVDGVGTAFTLRAYSEGLHIRDCVVIGEAGLSTGSIAYSGNGMTAPFINLLGLYISGSEFNTRSSSLDLYLVDTGWISDSHFSTHTSSDAAVQITGSTLLHINACSMTGQFNPLSAASFTGVAMGTTTGGASTTFVSIDDCDFTNLSCAIAFGPGTNNSTATGVRMLAPGNTMLVSGSLTVSGSAVVTSTDTSGNTTNTCISVGSTTTRSGGATKFTYSKP